MDHGMLFDLALWIMGAVISVGGAITGWIFKMVFGQIKKIEDTQISLTRSLSDHKLHVAETFAPKTEVNAGFVRVMEKLDKIDEKLDKKVDK